MNNDNTSIIILGATGDLTSRKLVPALFSLYRRERLPAEWRIVGYARREWDDAFFRETLRTWAEKAADFDAAAWESFAARLYYMRGDLTSPDDYRSLNAVLDRMEAGEANRLYYLAISPEYYEAVIEQLRDAGMANEAETYRRIVIEKPFGYDLSSAAALNRTLHRAFSEGQVYRIDHYLGKETVQNLLFFRFANAIFEPIWNRNYIDHVQITVAETVDVEHRAGYYDKSGVMRDMFQNHLMQLLSLVALEPPATSDANSLRNEKVKVLRAVRPVAITDTVRAQYAGYTTASGIDPVSATPTFAAIKLFVDNWRWMDVPFYLRSGKAMAKKVSEIVVQFRRPPHLFFNLPPGKKLHPNILSMCIQPDEGIHLRFQAKVPNSPNEVQPVVMEFHFSSTFEGALPDAYERLLLDAMQGDAALFTREDEIELSWRLIDNVLAGWASPGSPPMLTYAPGTWGPDDAEMLLADDGRRWRIHCGEH
ncbi:MAG: glucose-6-phosphate dehydrogenase [Anaerolineae bacterium]|nr:glucose-6-phosphate dehydrogenase [Anaerolineae bacterium]NUQ04322.1 glucose-6-phosphate dehydrogenase [Anaerolineae bacterium]